MWGLQCRVCSWISGECTTYPSYPRPPSTLQNTTCIPHRTAPHRTTPHPIIQYRTIRQHTIPHRTPPYPPAPPHVVTHPCPRPQVSHSRACRLQATGSGPYTGLVYTTHLGSTSTTHGHAGAPSLGSALSCPFVTIRSRDTSLERLSVCLQECSLYVPGQHWPYLSRHPTQTLYVRYTRLTPSTWHSYLSV